MHSYLCPTWVSLAGAGGRWASSHHGFSIPPALPTGHSGGEGGSMKSLLPDKHLRGFTREARCHDLEAEDDRMAKSRAGLTLSLRW